MTFNESTASSGVPSREQLIHTLYEAAELEHNLMCTYLYAAFSLKSGEAEGLTPDEAAAIARWRRAILDIAIGEMGHLVAVWNITSALGGVPRFGRGNFPLDPGYLPAGVVVKLAPFDASTLQHFVYLERPAGSNEPDGQGFEPERTFTRGMWAPRLTPMALDYETVGAFYAQLSVNLRRFADGVGEKAAFCGDPALQLSPSEVEMKGAARVICLKTALAAFDAIVAQGEGAPEGSTDSHFEKFVAIRTEYAHLLAANPSFAPAFPAARNPVLRRPPRPEGRVWIENEQASTTVDLANAAYGLMLRLIAYAYSVRGPHPEKALAVDIAIALMQTMALLGERAARLPAGPSNPECHAGVSFTALRDSAPFPEGSAARRFFVERLYELSAAAEALRVASPDSRVDAAARQLVALAARGEREFAYVEAAPVRETAAATPVETVVESSVVDGVEVVEGTHLTLDFEAKRCIHARFCVTGAPRVFLANVQGPWIHPDAMDVEALAAIAHACPSGAIRYKRKDGRPDETAPPVNLIAIREAGPYAVRADIRLDGNAAGYRATLCRCGASKNKPFCDGSHHDVGFAATGEPATGQADMLETRDGTLSVDPQIDGPLQVRGNLEITSGTGRVVARVQSARLCRCGASNTKPFCDGSHARIGFRSQG
ncbi:ferritin-like domain-containing protein [Dokdonella soli]|uniref:Iron-binding zinc finger CDGSH type domain-containing protein n=1 Tax=Dokdonella soli TaxID=529810 RepID=A0ABN1IR73_9GAMM